MRKERERLLQIIHLCSTIDKRGVDPFEVDVKQKLEALRKYLPDWESFGDLCLDAEALNKLSRVIELQGSWLKFRSSLLYVDPFLIEFKVKNLEVKTLFEIFVKAWKPIVEIEQLSPQRVMEAVDYWNKLQPIRQRLRRMPFPPGLRPGSLTLGDMLRQGFLSEHEFTEVLQTFWQELTQKAACQERIPYWSFIYAESYEETVARAYLTSFLITYGYATLEVEPLSEEKYLRPNKEIKPLPMTGRVVSVPISIEYRSWREAWEAKHLE